METKVYVVTEVCPSGCGREVVVALRLTHGAARSVAREGGNRRVSRHLATKDGHTVPSDKAEQRTGGQHGDEDEAGGLHPDVHPPGGPGAP